MKIYYLYVKTHNITGLKYLGKTINSDPFAYLGSGKYWNLHLDKHGRDLHTDILHEFDNENELKEYGLYYSHLWDIVKSDKWANLKVEEGQGGFSHLTHEQIMAASRLGGSKGGKIGQPIGHKVCKEKQIGIYAISKERRREIGLKCKALGLGMHGLSPEKRKYYSKLAASKGGTKSKEMKVGIWGLTSEQRKFNSGKGGYKNKGRRRYNNGSIEIRIYEHDLIPDGFTKGGMQKCRNII